MSVFANQICFQNALKPAIFLSFSLMRAHITSLFVYQISNEIDKELKSSFVSD